MIEKTADEMFKELELYHKFEDFEFCIYRGDYYNVEFNKKTLRYEIIGLTEIHGYLHKAITKKMEELGWL